MTYKIPLVGYKSPPLSLNPKKGESSHWAAKRRRKQDLQERVIQAANIVKLPKRLTRVHVTLHWAPDVERQRDDDNPMLTLKAAADALVTYGLVPTDDYRVMTRSVEIHPVDKMPPLHFYGRSQRQPARVWLTVEDLSPAPSGLLLGDRPTPPDTAA